MSGTYHAMYEEAVDSMIVGTIDHTLQLGALAIEPGLAKVLAEVVLQSHIAIIEMENEDHPIEADPFASDTDESSDLDVLTAALNILRNARG